MPERRPTLTEQIIRGYLGDPAERNVETLLHRYAEALYVVLDVLAEVHPTADTPLALLDPEKLRRRMACALRIPHDPTGHRCTSGGRMYPPTSEGDRR